MLTKIFSKNFVFLLSFIIFAITMHIDDCQYTRGNKTYRRVLLRQSYREGKKTRQMKIANISHCSEEDIESIKYALKYKNNLRLLTLLSQSQPQSWKIAAPSILIYQLIHELGLHKLFSNHKEGKYLLWQVMCRLIQPGSQLGNVRLAKSHGGCELLGIKELREKHLYESLDWLYDRKSSVEKQLFKLREKTRGSSTVFLYDVTSSYFEGTHNELATFGYNRDKKKGKMQLVYGLLTDADGFPLAVEAFQGNTKDEHTLSHQIRRLKQQYGCKRVVIVGDKGMIKQAGIEEIETYGMDYITSITKPQMEKLVKKGVFQRNLFEDELTEVYDNAQGLRYILRRNPERAEEIKQSRRAKIEAIQKRVADSNSYLNNHPKARLQVQYRRLTEYIAKLKLTEIATVSMDEDSRKLTLDIDNEKLSEIGRFDGCYVIKTNIPEFSPETIHERYKSLSQIEWAFRTEKSQLQVRPIYLRKSERTISHLFICMLAYIIERHLREKWKDFNITVAEGIEKLSTIAGVKLTMPDGKKVIKVLEPDHESQKLLKAANIKIPNYLPNEETNVFTTEKLNRRRK